MNMYKIAGCECLIEELEVGDEFMLVRLNPNDTTWVESSHPVPHLLRDQKLTLAKRTVYMHKWRHHYRRAGNTGYMGDGAIVIKL